MAMRWTGNFAVHFAFETAGYLAASLLYALQRARRGDVLPDATRATIIAAAAAGAMFGSRLLYLLCDPAQTLLHLTDSTYLLGGKTIVGGLLGGLIAVELVKKVQGIRRSTGDAFVEPLILAMCIGRIGCFLTGPIDRTAGIATSVPWAIAIADGVPRHPVALYEIAFLLVLLPLTRWIAARSGRDGYAFRTFLASYLAFRLGIDFLKPEPRAILLGMSSIQWACAAGLIYYASIFLHDYRDAALPLLRRRRVDLHDVLPQD